MLPLHKLEIDVTNSKQINEAAQIATEHFCAAVVVTPELVQDTLIARNMYRGKWKIISTVDTPKGLQFADNKFRGMPVQSLSADGYEILLTYGEKNDIAREIKYLNQFYKGHFSPLTEFRYTLDFGTDKRDEKFVQNVCDIITKISMPSFLRNTHLCKVSATAGSKSSLEKQTKMISDKSVVPVKLSGNIDADNYTDIVVPRFGVNLKQARSIIRKLKEANEKLTAKGR